LCPGVEGAQHGQEALAVRVGDQIDLVQDQHIAEFDLIDQEVYDGARILSPSDSPRDCRLSREP
jgi:hypothetical protein